MDLTMIEVPPTAQVGDEVVVIGSQGREMISAMELGKRANTTHYEIVTRIPNHLRRKLA
jgi:alanine racemase